MKIKEETLDGCLKEIMSHMRAIDTIQDMILEKYGIRVHVSNVGMFCKTGDICIRNGIDEVAKAFGQEAKRSPYSRDRKEYRHYGVEFYQYADDKTKHFTEANEQKPKVEYV